MAQRSWDPTLTSQAFWQSWAVAHVGAAAADAVAAVFDSIDSFKTPRPVQWLNGPGGLSRTCVCVYRALSLSGSAAVCAILATHWRFAAPPLVRAAQPDQCKWKAEYSFVDTFMAARGSVSGALNLARFDYWLQTMQYMRGTLLPPQPVCVCSAALRLLWVTPLLCCRPGPSGVHVEHL